MNSLNERICCENSFYLLYGLYLRITFIFCMVTSLSRNLILTTRMSIPYKSFSTSQTIYRYIILPERLELNIFKQDQINDINFSKKR